MSRQSDAPLVPLVYHHIVVDRQIISDRVATPVKGVLGMSHHAKVFTMEKEVD